MFRNRKNSQKPSDELYSAFKQTLTELDPNVSAALPAENPGVTLDDPLAIPIPLAGQENPIADIEHHKGLNDQWRFTQSAMDPNALAFSSFTNPFSEYYPPTPNGANTIYQCRDGDPNTQNIAMNTVNPLAAGLASDPTIDMCHLQPQLQHQQFNHLDPFAQPPSFAPSTFIHHDPIYQPIDHTSIDNINAHVNSSLSIVTNGMGLGDRMNHQPMPGNDFRYHVTLRAPTAMVKQADEIPMTYLNKGQAYTLSVVDTAPPAACPQPIKYRTYVRVSFEDEQQRSKPATCWQLWKEGRGSNEAHQRGGRLLAVEYVDPNQGGDDGSRHPQITLESASFDGFCVTWSPNHSSGSLSRDISVRFNFLSTDFSHSKGVKGIPVRLCTKTEMICPGPLDEALAEKSEVSFCKVKLFRDHGAERKLSNDVAHVRKSMDKLKQQIAQVELGAGNFGKRKRTGSFATKDTSGRITKHRHRRSGSADSQAESNGRMSVKDDLQAKLSTLQDMFSSARPASILNLAGDEQDDPDLFPVCLSQEIQQEARLDTHSQNHWESRQSVDTPSANTPNILSPTASSNSINSPARSSDRQQLPFGNPAYNSSHRGSMDWSSISRRGSESHLALGSQKSLLNHPIKIEKSSVNGSASSFEAVGVDSSYTPPSDRPPRAVACFYVRFGGGGNDNDGYYRATYLSQRTTRELLDRISEKCNIDPSRIVRAFRVQNGRKIIIDDDVVRQIPEGQDMVIELSNPGCHSPLMHKADIEMSSITDYPTPTTSVDLQLIF